MDKRLDTIERHKHVQLLEACARIDTNSTSFEVAQCLRNYIRATMPNLLIVENQGFTNSHEQIIRFAHDDYSGYWVVIIKDEDIKKYGRDCITAYHMRSGIDFAKAYSFPNYNKVGFCAAYETLCEHSQHMLYRYDFRLSCEALVSQMLFMRA